ncbi:MAG: NAD(P)H-dependent oxidoreductase subunit E, partial [Candidatus Rokubacteria bacterium]|nr:NAD(P)H-dependent oxidoreductase subunit E [Candidatus Rokubacteria bacterium]
MAEGLQLGIDVGGTFTDVVLVDPATGQLECTKTLTTPTDQSEGVINAMRALLERTGRNPADLARLIHGTTMATNALLERKGARTALVTTRGFRDVLEIGRAQKPRIYDIHDDGRPAPLVPRRWRMEVTERIGPDGQVELPLDPSEVGALQRRLVEEGIEAVAAQLKMPVSTVFGALSFYAEFLLAPAARTTITWCSGPACRLAGGDRIREALEAVLGLALNQKTPDDRAGLRLGQCNGTCQIAPMVWVNGRPTGPLTVSSAIELARSARV